MNKTIKVLLTFFILLLVYIGSVLVYGTIRDFQPEEVMRIQPHQQSTQKIISDKVLTFVTWNLGYGGLGAEANLFYDNGNIFFSGGKMIRPPRKLVKKYVNGFVKFTKEHPSDFHLYQEVDYHSRRSYYFNQYEAVSMVLPFYSAAFSVNYKVDWVPLPILEPWHAYGRTYSGLGSWSRFQPAVSTRYQLPGEFSWPTRIFQLDRCLLVQKFPTSFGKDLVIVNIHNSAYDKGGTIKEQQMVYIKNLLEKAYAAGNYVIVGGDWNQCPPDFPFDALMPGKTQGHTQTNISKGFMNNSAWQWVTDTRTATNRKTRNTYEKGTTFETIIDFFLISPNVELLEVKGFEMGFAFSDHQPVKMRVRLKKQ